MFSPKPFCTCNVRRLGARVAVYAGVGMSLSIAGLTAQAGDILRGGSSTGARGSGRSSNVAANPVAPTPALGNARDALARTTRAMQAVQAMQAAARDAARRGANNLGFIPHQPGKRLPNVPNGLAPGGLQVLPGVPVDLANPTAGENRDLWKGAKLPKQKVDGGQTIVTIKQTEPQALLNWQTFNVGKETVVNFNQKGGTQKDGSNNWVAFNKIADPSGVPSQILGSINADGTVYLINHNGIVFGGSSQINLHSLVASSLPINDNLISRGLLNNPDAQFLFSALDVPGGSDGTPAFVPAPPPASGRFGDVIVQPGAFLHSPASGEGNGGRLMLVGANVRNEGTLSSPSGQTILAAGLQVAVAAHANDDPSLRGLDVWVGSIGDYAGTVTNSGLITSLTGSTTLTGRNVHQFGIIESSTSVDLNGRIDLRASYGAVGNPNFDNSDATRGFGGPPFLFQHTGVVKFGEQSVTRILPAYTSERTVPGLTLPEQSQINVEGLAIHLAENAMMLAPNADVTLRAGVWPYKDADGNRTTFDASGLPEARLGPSFYSGRNQKFLFSSGQIYLDNSALISVAGSTDVFVPLTHNILDVQFLGSELADSPVQREGILRGVSLTVDIRRSGVNNGRFWIGTPLGDVTGLAGLIQRNAAQLTAEGGNLTLRAGDSIVVKEGATLDVSGGFFRHEEGIVRTSRLLQDGRLVDIANAQPGQVYDGVYTGQFFKDQPRWGVTETYTSPFMSGERFEPGYIQGADGGTLTLSAASMAVDGELRGLTVEAPRGRSLPPAHSRLSISFAAEKLFEVSSSTLEILPTSPTPPSIIFAHSASPISPEPFRLVDDLPAPLREERVARVFLSPALLDEQGFGQLSVTNTDGNITLPAGVKLATPALGSITLAGANITINSEVLAPGGMLQFTAYNISPAFTAEFPLANPQGALAPLPNADRGLLTLGAKGALNVAGLLVDDRIGSHDSLTKPVVTNGGTITIDAYSAMLREGSSIDASGGVALSARGVPSYGNGGSITIRTGKDPAFGAVLGGTFHFGSTLRGYSGARGGSLTLQANAIQIGGSASFANTLLLQPEFFRKGGFANYALVGIGAARDAEEAPGEPEIYTPGILIAPGTRIEAVAQGLLALPVAPDAEEVVLSEILRPVGLRAPASVSFSALGADDVFTVDRLEVRGDVVVGKGAEIIVDPTASISLRGQTVSMFGSAVAPGGSIVITGASRFPLPTDQAANATFARPTVHIGAAAQLSTAGTAVVLPDAFDRRVGTLHAGGTISVSGNIVAERGAVLNVSGATAEFDLHPSMLGGFELPAVPQNSGVNAPLWTLQGVSTDLDSNGGVVDLQGSEMLFTDATLLGRSGGESAIGGTLSIFSGRFYTATAGRTSADINLVVTQNGRTIPTGSETGVGIALRDGTGAPIPAMGYFAADRFTQGAFDSLDLGFKFIDASPFPFGGNVEFRGPIHIVAPGKLRVAGGGVIRADAAVKLTGSYAALGQPFRPPLHPDDPLIPFQQSPAAPSLEFVFPPTFGPGTLSVRAELIDIGTLSLQNVGSARLVAAGGDIRGNGTLNIAGDLLLTAGQIYPTTLATFNIFAYDHNGGPGSVTITSAGVRSAPLSAGGTLNVFASEISQQGVLRAPLGSITLGWDGTDLDLSDADLDRPFNPIAGNSAQIGPSKSVMLGGLSITSVAGVAGASGMLIPFGLSPDGSSWIDPRGVNVTLNGLPEKRISMQGDSVVAKRGSTVDIRGGGNLSAFRWVPGLGGSIDLLGSASGEWNAGVEYSAGDLVTSGGRTWAARVRNSGERPSSSLFWSLVPESYAVLPGFSSEFAPYAPFNTGANAEALGGDPGFVSSGLQVGDRLFVDGVEGLDAGIYTLLPRKYALLPGAFLVTPTTERPVGTFTLPEGATLTSGLRVNTFSRPDELAAVRTRFEVAPSEVVQARVQYEDFSGNEFFREAAARFDVKRPQRLPMDAGFAAIHGNVGLDTLGSILTSQPLTGRGAGIDLSSSADIYIVARKSAAPEGATAVLNTGVLNSWGAESLVIGGLRHTEPDSTLVDVRTGTLVVNNAGKSLAAPDITLLSQEALALETGSSVKSSGPLSSFAEKLEINGDGTLVRVSGARGAGIVRSGVGTSTEPLLTIAADSRIAGRNVTLDSTYGTSLDASTTLNSKILTLGSGQISIILDAQSTELTGSIVEPHLVLAGDILNDVQQVSALTLRSYRTIDLYGAGQFGNDSLGKLTLFAAGLRGYDHGAGSVRLQSRAVSFGNPSNVGAVAAPAAASGTLQFDAGTIVFGSNAFTAAGYETVALNATGGVLGEGTGSFTAQNALRVTSPVVTGARGSMQTIAAGGALVLESNGAEPTVRGGLGASFTFRGSSVLANGDIILPSGQVVLRATTGDVIVGGTLNVDGTKREFYDLTRFSDAGSISLVADAGDVELAPGSLISVAAIEGGNAGSLIINASQGGLRIAGATLRGNATVEKRSASFSLDVGTLPSFSDVASALNVGGFLEQRDFRVRTGDVVISNPFGQTNAARIFTLAADQGDIRVTGAIDASGKTGGQIALVAGGSLILESGSLLTVHGKEFSNAGKGGEIRLEAGAAYNGQPNLTAHLDVQSGSTIDLGVDSFQPGAYTTAGSSAFRGQFTGKLHLRAPRAGSDVNINPLGGAIVGASSIIAEAYQLYDRSGIGTLDSTLRSEIHADNEAFMSAGYAPIRQKLLSGSPDAGSLGSVLVVAPGVEIINRTGNLTLGTTVDNAANDWNLATFRYGPQGAPGVLTLRAAGNIEILNALSDGFSGGVPAGTPVGQQLWLSRLMDITSSLPVNTQSWSYRLTAGADLSAVDFRRVQSTGALDQLAQTNGSSAPLGSVQIGKFYPAVLVSGADATTAAAINNRYQVVRTGSGDIEIHAGRDLQLRNQFATVYTAGVRVPDPTTIFASGDFVRPIVERGGQTHPNQGSLGAVQQVYPAQWSMAGGNVAITAQGDAARVTLHNGRVIADSSRQLPSNWLYRRGVIDPGTGLFGAGSVNTPRPFENVNDPSASTAWWIDFSNFFEGIGALGGGDVKLVAGSNIVNVDAFAPTNARMPGRDAVTGANLAPDASKLVELGGGDLLVRAGANIDGGVYYVERGQGTLFAGQAITTNSARSPSLGILGSTSFDPALVESNAPAIFDRRTWLPTTLFVGKSDFDVSARGDILLGPAANPFLLPQGVNNKFWYKSYFNTFAQDASVTVASFGGSVTHRLAVTLPTGSTIPTLQAFIGAQNLLTSANASNHQPWIRITELDVGGFGTVLSVTAPAMRTTAFAGDVSIVGPLTLFPAPRGTLELAASGGVIGLQPSGRLLTGSALTAVTGYTAATINISDADPLATLRITSPLAYQNLVGRELLALRDSQLNPYSSVNLLFQETGSFTGAAATIETQRALHAPGPLHFGDESPVRIYAGAGDITGLTLFSPKTAQVLAKNDIADVSFYVQNLVPTDISVIAAGRDIIPHNENATVRTLADDPARGNAVVDTPRSTVSGPSNLLAGDIQINGPGVLEVLAGRNLDLGTGANFIDGTGVGLTSIGNARNPFLPVAGADLIAFAGVRAGNGSGPALGLAGSSLDVERFISEYVEGRELDSAYLNRIGFTGTFDTLTTEQQAIVALEVFYRELRDAGRNFPTVGTYQSGLDAIDTLFGESARVGEIFTRARDIRTAADGNILLGAPKGGLTMASDIFGNPLTPPGIVTESGGGISIFTDADVDIGQARIFTLRGGDIMIWSSTGDIAAGTAPKTVVTAPPTRVVIDVSSANVKTDLGGLATGGGIGVLAAVEGVEPGDVDLIAPQGVVDAGDAGIRVSGNLNIAATQVLNAGNIAVSGASAGVPSTPTVAAPSLGSLTAASSTVGATNSAANQVAKQQQTQAQPKEELPSIITVEVLGFGGGGPNPEEEEDEEERKRRQEAAEPGATAQAIGGRSAVES